jgi:hypothetical protein
MICPLVRAARVGDPVFDGLVSLCPIERVAFDKNEGNIKAKMFARDC